MSHYERWIIQKNVRELITMFAYFPESGLFQVNQKRNK